MEHQAEWYLLEEASTMQSSRTTLAMPTPAGVVLHVTIACMSEVSTSLAFVPGVRVEQRDGCNFLVPIAEEVG